MTLVAEEMLLGLLDKAAVATIISYRLHVYTHKNEDIGRACIPLVARVTVTTVTRARMHIPISVYLTLQSKF